MIRCDKPMKRAKEEAVAKHPVADQWRCNGDCVRCVCALKKNNNGTWEHVNTNSKKPKVVDDECLYLGSLQE